METRAALIAIIANDNKSSEQINSVLHEYSEYIIGRMGIPYHQKDLFIICTAG